MRTKDTILLEQAYETVTEGFSVDPNNEMANKVLSYLFDGFKQRGEQTRFQSFIISLEDERLIHAYRDWNNEHISNVGNFTRPPETPMGGKNFSHLRR